MKNRAPDFFCILPWRHLMIQSDGRAYTCCEASASAAQEGLLGNVRKEKLEKIWNHPQIQKVREELLKGTIPSQCQKCAHLEAMGVVSDRLQANQKFSSDVVGVQQEAKKELKSQNLISLDLRLSNMCNFTCRTCNPEQSSKWALDYHLLTGQKLKGSPLTRTFGKPEEAAAWILDGKIQPQRLFFAGGEPLIHLEHYHILEALKAKGLMDCGLEYITNLSRLGFGEYEVMKLWKDFRSIEITVSIDGIGKLGEYIRDGLNWEEFENNLKRVRKETPQARLSTNITLSALNIASLPGILQYCLEELKLQPESFILNPLIDPLPYRLTILPQQAKEVINKNLSKAMADLPSVVGSQVQGIMNYMNSKDESRYWDLFLAHNKRIDQIRSQDFKSVSPLFEYLT